DLSEEEAAKLTADYRKLLTDGGAEIGRDEPWGRRRLAFPIERRREAYYHLFQVRALPALVSEVERRLRLSEQVLRHLAVRADEEWRRSAKRAERIGIRPARRPPRPPAIPASPEPEAAPAAPEGGEA